MKKYIITFFLAFCVTIPLAAQQKSWGEINIAMEQNFMLSKWFDDPEMSKMIPKMNNPCVMFGVDVRLIGEFGVFWNIGFGITKEGRGFADDYNTFDRMNRDKYYVENLENNKNARANLKTRFGFFYRFHHKDWTFVRQIGFGATELNYSQLKYTLKKKGANDKYNVNYAINRKNEYQRDVSGFVMLKLKAERKIAKKVSVNFTLEYDFYIEKPKYTAGYTNYYDDVLVESHQIKGNRIHGLTLGVGIGFR